jgi:hypothetical protein
MFKSGLGRLTAGGFILCLMLIVSLCHGAETQSNPDQAKSGEKAEVNTSNNAIDLVYDDGVQAGKLSISGGGHCVKFTAPKDANILTAVKVYGSRYGEAEPPAEDFHIWLCSPNLEVIKEFAFPYSEFKMRGLAKWVTLETEPTAIPAEFIICVGFDPHQTKGVYVYYDGQSGGRSFTGLPGDKLEPFNKGDWMIRAVLGKGDQKMAKEEKQASSKQPLIVATSPKALANDVSPTLDVITVTFDQPMMDKSWSWTGGGETYPKTTGEPSYDQNKTTCTMPVTLEPGKVYWVGINSPSFRNFKSADGVPARRYAILFATKGADGNATAIPEELLAKAKAINEQK